jgi:hypothetical protein
MLVSGSLRYVDSFIGSIPLSNAGSTIGVVDHHFHGRVRNGQPAGISVGEFNNRNIWTLVRHESVGGVTRFAGLFCSSIDIDPIYRHYAERFIM